MKPTRDGFGAGLLKLGGKNKNVVVLSADLTESVRAHHFQEKYPERFFSVGVAEQDMIGSAAGLALSGKIPFACTFSVFASGRAWDQVRVSACYMNLNIKIAASHGGITVGPDGATHQALEDIAIMRALPNMTVIVPADALEAEKATIAAASYPGPVFLRLGRPKVPAVTEQGTPFKVGKGDILSDGDDLTIVACGIMVHPVLEAAKALKKENISARVINMHTIKPIDTALLIASAKKTGCVVTCEEHSMVGGLGSAVCEILSCNYPVPIEVLGIPDVFGFSGESEELLNRFNLNASGVIKHARQVLKRKNA